MGDFHRQQSKVWWSSFPVDDESDICGNKSWMNALSTSLPVDRNNRDASNANPAAEDAEDGHWSNAELSRSRGESSSPSQGSHKSQDSGFSDSELQNALSTSPQDSPDLSKRLADVEEQSKDSSLEETQLRTRGSPIKKFSYHAVEFSEDCCNTSKTLLETNFSLNSSNNSAKGSPVRNGYIPSNDNEKMNKIQNKLELSLKLPKKLNSVPSGKVSNLVAQIERNEEFRDITENTDATNSVSAKSSTLSLEHTVIEQPFLRPKEPEPRKEIQRSWAEESSRPVTADLDSDGFKIPKCADLRGSCTFLNFTENAPVSCSTPKASSPVPRPARAKEKIIGTKSFATVRKLKALSDNKIRRSERVNRTLARGACSESEDQRHSVAQWLEELESLYEAEIMTTLQSKSLATDLTRQVTNMAATTSDTVRKLHRSTKVISSEFTKLCQHMKCKKYSQVGPLVQSLVGHIKEFITEYVLSQKIAPVPNPPSATKLDNDKTLVCENARDKLTGSTETINSMKAMPTDEVLATCDRLQELAMRREFDLEAVEEQRNELAKEFRKVVDTILLSHVKALVNVLEEPRTELALRTALSALCTLGLEGDQLSTLVAQCEGIRALLAVCFEARATAVRVSALRALATVCCAAESVLQFQQAGGIEILSDLLADRRRTEPELSEAAAVLAQITAPWIEHAPTLPELSHHLATFVSALTYLVQTYKSSETLLLSTAALANLSFLEPRTVWSLLERGTAGILLAAVRKQGPKVSVFIQEQAATVIANMASIPECRGHLAQHRAVVALLCFLQIRHSPSQRPAEIAAAERVLQKTAIALSRLCSDSIVAQQVIDLHGVNRLVRLCKDERERNHSDGVLVACLAALRKIVANCGNDAVAKLDAMQLVEPKLLDSFLLYSSRQESYV